MICDKSYKESQLQTHLLLHKKPRESPPKVNPIPQPNVVPAIAPTRPNPNPQSNASYYNTNIPNPILPPSLTSVYYKAARHSTIPYPHPAQQPIPPIQSIQPIQPSYSIAPYIPRTDKTIPPKKTNIFKPEHLGLGLGPQCELSY